MKTRIAVAGLAAAAALAVLEGAQAPPFGSRGTRPLPSTRIRLTDVTAAAGVKFVHASGATGRHYYVETVAAGACFLDYNRDGWLDLFFVQGGELPEVRGTGGPSDVLYRNNGNGTFTDVTREAGLTDDRYGIGCAVGDIENDGDADLFVTNLSGSVLYRNEGKGRFADVTQRSRIDSPSLTTAAAFVDYDHDGWLDLFVARYMEYSIATDKPCVNGSISRYCAPLDYSPAANRLFRNNRDGSFADVSEKSGIAGSTNYGLGIANADYNDDGLVDIFVSSDQAPNLLFINAGNGTFRETALAAGVAVSPSGRAMAGMGVDVNDYDNDGWPDLFITNYEGQTNSLYRNLGNGKFNDESTSSNVHFISNVYLGWGTRFVDFDLDGHQDLFVVNGHVDDHADRRVPVTSAPPGYPTRQGYAQRAQVYANNGKGRFEDLWSAAGEFFERRHVSRGAAFGDVDNDGDTDIVIANNNQPAVVLRNDTPASPWARLELQGAGCNRDALGARVRVTTGSIRQTQFVRSGTSYLSDHDRRLLFALPGGGPGRVEIRWPCGATETHEIRAGHTQKVIEKNHNPKSR